MTRAYDPETVVLGVVGKPHGVRGELWLRPHNEHGRTFEGLRELLLVKDGAATTHAIVSLKLAQGGAIVRLAGVDTREAAAALTLAEVCARRSALPPLAPGEFYVHDVLGCRVLDESGRELGVVESTFWNGAHDVMIVRGPGEPPREEMVPLLPQFIVTMDAPGRRIIVSWESVEGDD